MLHADGRSVKPRGTSKNKTASMASVVREGIARNSRAANREFFRHPPLPDGPRRRPVPRRHSPVEAAIARDNGAPARDGTPYRSHSSDNAVPPAIATSVVQHPDRLGCNTWPSGERGRTTFHNPSKGRCGDDAAWGFTAVATAKNEDEGHTKWRSGKQNRGPETSRLGSAALLNRPTDGPPSIHCSHPAPTLPLILGHSL